MIVLFGAAFAMFFGATNPSTGASLLLLMLPLYYISIALAVKRLKDRDRPIWFVALFFGPALLALLGEMTGLTVNAPASVAGIPDYNTAGWVLQIVSGAMGLWALIELGFLRGTVGDNQWGPDPVAK